MKEKPLGSCSELEVKASVSVVVNPVSEEDFIFKLGKPGGARDIHKGSSALVLEESDTMSATDEKFRRSISVEVLP